MFKRIDHVGIVVDDLIRAKKFMESLGLTFEYERELPERNVKAAFYRCGDGRIELIEPTTKEARARRLGQGARARIEHIAVEVNDDIVAAIEVARGLGVDFITPHPVPIDGNLNIFTKPDSSEGIQFQLVEKGVATM